MLKYKSEFTYKAITIFEWNGIIICVFSLIFYDNILIFKQITSVFKYY